MPLAPPLPLGAEAGQGPGGLPLDRLPRVGLVRRVHPRDRDLCNRLSLRLRRGIT